MNHPLFDAALRAHQAGNLGEAARLCRDLLEADPGNFNAVYLLGYLQAQSGQTAEAERLIAQAIEINPHSPDAHYNRGCLLQKLNRFEDAILCFEKAVSIKPDYVDAMINRGITLAALKRYDEGVLGLDQALRIRPGNVAVWVERGNALTGWGRYRDALLSYGKALDINPRDATALENRGLTLMLLQRHSEALADFDNILSTDPRNVAAWTGRGNALGELHRDAEALAAFRRALVLNPHSVATLLARGYLLLQLTRYREALADYDKALMITPNLVQGLINRAATLFELKRPEDAYRDYEQALSIDRDIAYARGNLVFYKLHACDWRGLEQEQNAVSAALQKNRRVILPFVSLALSSSPAEQAACARIWVSNKHPPEEALWRGESYHHDRMRIAYLSADFHAHATAHLISGVFEHHDRRRFEIIAISYGPDDESEMRGRLMSSFDSFIDVRTKNDFEVASLLRGLEVDAAIDLKGLTKDSRCGILAFRPAPIQAHYLGYPGTMGSSYVDYILADGIVIPEDHRRFYTEHVAYLPDTYQCNDAARAPASRAKTRTEYGLPESGFVFCCFNNTYKIRPEMFEIWMRLLAQVENSVLWMVADNADAAQNLTRAATDRGIAVERLIFAARLGVAEHLARHHAADLFLDTLPYGAHTTASDALWTGLPVVTCIGSTFAGRVAASLLHSIGLPDLVCHSLRDYEALALNLARDPAALHAVKEKLVRNRDTHPLFDTVRFTRNLELALTTMWERHKRGEPPASFAVDGLARA